MPLDTFLCHCRKLSADAANVNRCRQPFYGYVKRAVNRAPGKADPWWRSHQDTCGGKFVKIRSPDPKKTEKVKTSAKSAKITEFKSEPNSQSADYQSRIGTIEHSFGTEAELGAPQSGTISTQSCGIVRSTMEIDLTSPIVIQNSDDETKPEPVSSTPSHLLTPPNSPPTPSPMCTSPIYSTDATQSTSKNRTTPRFSPYTSTQPLSQSTSRKRTVLTLQECLFCNGFFRKESFEEHFNDCVKCFPTD